MSSLLRDASIPLANVKQKPTLDVDSGAQFLGLSLMLNSPDPGEYYVSQLSITDMNHVKDRRLGWGDGPVGKVANILQNSCIKAGNDGLPSLKRWRQAERGTSITSFEGPPDWFP